MTRICFAYPAPISTHSTITTPRPPSHLSPTFPLTFRVAMHPTATLAAPSETRSPSVPTPPSPGVVHTISTPEQFDTLLAASRADGALLVADFMASWCRKCLYLLPRLRKLSTEHPEAYFCAVDVNKVKRLPKEYGIRAMPTFVFLKGGERLDTLVGGEAPGKVAEGLRERVETLGGRDRIEEREGGEREEGAREEGPREEGDKERGREDGE